MQLATFALARRTAGTNPFAGYGLGMLLRFATLFLFAFVGGITTVTGALLGGLLFALLPLVQSEAQELVGAALGDV